MCAIVLFFFCVSCVEPPTEAEYNDRCDKQRSLRTVLTRSTDLIQEDSLTIMSKLQSDVDNLMMGRVIQRDSVFVLAIHKEDALFIGISEDVYNKYLDYVDWLNDSL